MKALILALFTITASMANAGTGVSGGGGVVYCPATSSVELFDYYEGRTLRNLSFDLGPSTLTYMEKVHFVLQRMSPLSRVFASQLWKRAQDFVQTAAFIPNAKLNPIDDVNGVFLPTGCDYVQAVAQKGPVVSGDPFYIVDKNLWDMMSEDTKAGMILHEIIYRTVREKTYGRTTDSTMSRYFNSRIASPTIANMSAVDYFQLLTLTEVPGWDQFLWQDTHGLWWTGNYGCSTLGAGIRDATRSDIVASYPELGAKMKSIGWFDNDKYEKWFFYEDSNSRWSNMVLWPDHLTYNDPDVDQFHSISFCVGQTNPFPL